MRSRLLGYARRAGTAWGLRRTDEVVGPLGAAVPSACAAARLLPRSRSVLASPPTTSPPQGSDGQTLAVAREPSNVQVWMHILATTPAAGWGVFARWCLSMQRPARDVEHALGCRAGFLADHVDAPESEGRQGVAEVCLAIHGEGPQTFEGLFVRGSRGELLLNGCSRRCA